MPVTIKVRKGIDDDLLTYLDAGAVAEAEGAAAIGLHARTAAQLYAGRADWDAIARLVQAVAIPVLGNGDVFTAFDALAMMRSTGCAAVIVGRGCLGRPWLFRELADAFDGREPSPPPRFGEVRRILLDHADRMIDFFGEPMAMRQMRKWAAWYTVGFPGSAKLRAGLVRIDRREELVRALEGLPADLPFPEAAVHAHRAKGGKRQRVTLPEGYLEDREDDTPPRSPRSEAEIRAWERALGGG